MSFMRNNAGIMFCPFKRSEDGIEIQFATNHLGHFLLTNLLLDKMKQTAKTTGKEGRFLNLSSIAHNYTYRKGIRFHKINDRNGYSNKKAYGQSKLANILHTNELSRRMKEEGVNITANSVHPGVIMTPLMRHSSYLMHFLKEDLLHMEERPAGSSHDMLCCSAPKYGRCNWEVLCGLQ
ncbi:short-chain dehydrogenase TIC 32 A, chloroplastic-like [Lotus japonicus]|uniref:short-chain dehydrogenase TIC 32 A, chloroplastic-like n=1 Tax=Lotus japonicus TaxID=34305 RepID=UPI00258D3B55|nr:short-chain dehydrogenase TIC 32 A, chloroplastic-like [Lotus japonicus]